MIKKRELNDEHSCFNKAAMDEPIFVLRASDVLAPMTIRIWAFLLKTYKRDRDVDVSKALYAEILADAMETYAKTHYNGGKVPD